MTDYSYQGAELDLFQRAVNWKRYYASALKPYIAGDVLEVGAGIGGTGRYLVNDRTTTWTCLEPDAGLVSRLAASVRDQPLGVETRIVTGTVERLSTDQSFDTILYIDVLEHIQHDAAELASTARHLRARGHVIVLAPAHQWLFSPFDSSIGHFRRYTKKSLIAVAPERLHLVQAFYLDSVGMLASLANRTFLKASYPTPRQIEFWDENLVRASQMLDPLTARMFGKTVVAVWTPASAAA